MGNILTCVGKPSATLVRPSLVLLLFLLFLCLLSFTPERFLRIAVRTLIRRIKLPSFAVTWIFFLSLFECALISPRMCANFRMREKCDVMKNKFNSSSFPLSLFLSLSHSCGSLYLTYRDFVGIACFIFHVVVFYIHWKKNIKNKKKIFLRWILIACLLVLIYIYIFFLD